MRLTLAALALLPVVACAPLTPPGPTATLPADAVVGAGDPTQAAIYNVAYGFNNPGALRDPAAAARAAANMEYLATSLPQDPRFTFLGPEVTQLASARAELRGALGIASDADPQLVVDGLYGASRALRARDGAGAAQALSPAAFPQPAATVQRLAALPPLPLTAAAASATERSLQRQQIDRQQSRQSPAR
ncbi:hypothetical protein EOD42_14930 [Rhodovarius crocodyli]|uniref:Uncharacterized protein n=1 Tax=Rhodovarius crocodyli TaxID=1979269 RepID=A0A437MCX3_9PROT|nr:hypothetical protein [Rhodovarius crocodyli]RVT95504.1 hypothetical protein EOD42_14930 [Rhodovarius crocodyli]